MSEHSAFLIANESPRAGGSIARDELAARRPNMGGAVRMQACEKGFLAMLDAIERELANRSDA